MTQFTGWIQQQKYVLKFIKISQKVIKKLPKSLYTFDSEVLNWKINLGVAEISQCKRFLLSGTCITLAYYETILEGVIMLTQNDSE
jgi:hypothetical protein